MTYVAAVGDNPEAIEVRYEDENVWLTQNAMAELFDTTKQNIILHKKLKKMN